MFHDWKQDFATNIKFQTLLQCTYNLEPPRFDYLRTSISLLACFLTPNLASGMPLILASLSNPNFLERDILTKRIFILKLLNESLLVVCMLVVFKHFQKCVLV
jgi:hypothetical protein